MGELKTNAAAFAAGRDNVFARIAGRYDRLCDIFSFGIHRIWKRRMARRMAAASGDVILDLASGTGDIPMRYFAAGGAARTLWATDLSPEMLNIARAKMEGKFASLSFACWDAENLCEVETASVDVLSISFAMKICDRDKVLREAARVLKPGGLFLCLEASRIPVRAIQWLYLGYMNACMPVIGLLATGGDRSAYRYLLDGIHAFPDQRSFAREIAAAGFENVRYANMTFGIVALHEAIRS